MKKPERRMSIGGGEAPPPVTEEDRKGFVGGAKATTAKPAQEEQGRAKEKPKPKKPAKALPWEVAANPGPATVQLRTNPVMAAQLQYLKDNGHIRSFYSFAIEAVEAAIEAKLKEKGLK